MNRPKPFRSFRAIGTAQAAIFSIAFSALLIACSSTPDKPKPAELGPNAALISVKTAWSNRVGEVPFAVDLSVVGNTIFVASGDGSVIALDANSGRDIWRATAGGPIAAGVGSDGKVAAVVTRNNELVALSAANAGQQLWRQQLPAQVYTAPLVAGDRVFVVTADRAVTAFDGQTGRRLWQVQRPGDPLVLRQAGVLQAVGDTLVVGLSGRMVGLNPLNGSVRWEAPLASPRGTNEVERLVDLLARTSRVGDVVCARAFQSSVGCVNAARGALLWAKPANGSVGVHGDDRLVVGSESDGKVIAWQRATGERAWSTDRLLHRGLSAPLALGRSVAVGDSAGFVHLLSSENGSLLTRLSTDGTAVVAAPVLVGKTLVVATRGGGIFGFTPE
jgi:outer membrane protein assembly factor BamB